MRRGAILWGLAAGALLSGPWTPARAEPLAAGGPAPAALHCTIDDPRITESSGLVEAGDRLYTINDGGTRLVVYVLTASAGHCRVTGTITAAIDPYDVEDLARSADGTLWLADTGDNAHSRRTVAIELLTETGSARLFRFTYPDGPHDAEALLLDRAGHPFIVTKEPLGNSGVYTPVGTPSSSHPTPLRRVAGVQLIPTGTPGGPVGVVGELLVTGGAVSPDGTRVVLRTYTDAYLWRADDGDIARALTTSRPVRIPLPRTAQGEAVAFSPDGRTLLTSTEGRPAPVHAIPLGDLAAPPQSAAAPARSSSSRGGSAPRSDGSDALTSLVAALGLAAILVWGGGKVAAVARRR